MNNLQLAEQFRRALQMFAQTLTDEDAMEVATVFPAYVVGKTYKAEEMFIYGTNDVGDPQLYRVVQDHTSQADWTPDATLTLYTPIGLTDAGYPVWAQPTGAHDAYNTGDVVDYNGTLYASLIDGNVYSPEAYPAGWELYVESENEESTEPEPESDSDSEVETEHGTGSETESETKTDTETDTETTTE